MVLRYARQIVIFCFFMSVGLAGVLSQAGKRYPASPLWVFLGIAAWLALLLGTILWTRSRVDRVIHRIREETGTADDAFCALLAVKGRNSLGPFATNRGPGSWDCPCGVWPSTLWRRAVNVRGRRAVGSPWGIWRSVRCLPSAAWPSRRLRWAV